MKIIKLIIGAAIFLALVSSCKSKNCPGYGEAQNNNQNIEAKA